MKRKTTNKEILPKAIAQIINEKKIQGSNVKADTFRNYDDLMLLELSRLEQYGEPFCNELKCISKNIRKHLWNDNTNSVQLYSIIQNMNLVIDWMQKYLPIDLLWELNIGAEYLDILYKKRYAYNRSVAKEVFEKIYDEVQTVHSSKIIEKQWKNILESVDGKKCFIDTFDEFFVNAFEKYPEMFFKKLTAENILCRMVKDGDCNEDRFIPLAKSSCQNRWNPPGKSFLYMAYGEEQHPYNDDLTLEEYVCLLECRTERNTACSFCRFVPEVEGHIIDLSHNGMEFSKYASILDAHMEELTKKGLNILLNDSKLLSRRHDEKYVRLRVNQITDELKISDNILMGSSAKRYLQIMCTSIFKKVDGTEEEKAEAYRSFHILSEYLQDKGVTGIIFPCTRTEKVQGRNIVLFNPADAKPIKSSIKRYFYK